MLDVIQLARRLLNYIGSQQKLYDFGDAIPHFYFIKKESNRLQTES